MNLSEYLSELGQTRLPTAHVIDRDLKVCTLQFFPQVWPKNQLLDKWLIWIKEKGNFFLIETFLHFCNGNLSNRIHRSINLPKIINKLITNKIKNRMKILGMKISLFPMSWQSMTVTNIYLISEPIFYSNKYMYGFSSYKPLQNKSINLCWAQVWVEFFNQLKSVQSRSQE